MLFFRTSNSRSLRGITALKRGKKMQLTPEKMKKAMKKREKSMKRIEKSFQELDKITERYLAKI